MLRTASRSRQWGPSLATLAAFAVLGATIAWWALQLLTPPAAIAPAGSLIDTTAMPDVGPAQALFGSNDQDDPGAGSPAPDIRVLGVAAGTRRASAVLVVGNDIARAWAPGEHIDDHLRLIAVHEDRVVLERDGTRFELLPPARPSTSQLSGGSGHAQPMNTTPARQP